MIWEIVTICVLGVMTYAHVSFIKAYSSKIKQIEADIAEIDSSDEDDTNFEAIMDRFRISAQAKINRTSNLHVIIINCVFISGLLTTFFSIML